MKRLILDMLIGIVLLTYRTEVLFLFVYRFLIEPNDSRISCPAVVTLTWIRIQ